MAFNWAPIYNNARNSMFFVMMTPAQDGDDADELAYLADIVDTVDEGEEREDRLMATMLSTGFVVGMVAGDIGIMTTAHSLEHLFRASRPVTPALINRLYTVQVLCGHYENDYRQARSNAERAYSLGRVAWIDCGLDLMLVAVNAANVSRFGGVGHCQELHPSLLMRGDEVPHEPPTEECLMLSWPSYKPDMVSIGRIGTMRTVNEISAPNRCEYAMNILEVQMGSGKGSSGAPLLNQRGEVIGVLHGGHGGAHSYFICVGHVRHFLARFHIAPAPVPALPAPPVA